ncbi:glycosyltransferase family 9 protein [Azohydromonas caseinilytica]|uniref:Glycosyltransferase family 9 protein n=1 Tax=Azohydromonas caseinilytica TaxID=2728836 RepID=A0A848FGK4_9BURK|nr:glycosyltransferase family 9 protein [Azohydromonas caseinilytica]NML18588.1 glycosyltransferase family 9 protein [Azohydromonas caseinilytica]
MRGDGQGDGEPVQAGPAWVPGVRRIAVLRANAVGDFVLALPALAALRRAYPEAHVTLLARPWHAEFLRGRPSPVDEVVALPPSLGLDAADDPAELSALAATMRARRLDLALQLHGGGQHSNPLVAAFGARVSAGLQAEGAPPLQRNLPYRVPHPEALRLLETVALVGAPPVDIEPRLVGTAADRREAAAVLPPGAAPLLVLQPGCTDPRRAWPPERFAAVGDHFAALGAQVVLNGTRAEADVTRRVREAMRWPALDLGHKELSLGGLLALLERARLLVGNDTGTAHLARAVGLRSVTVFWIGNLLGYAPMTSARHAVAVSWRLHCPACGRYNIGFRCEHNDSFVDEVQTGQVLDQARGLWAEAAPPWADDLNPATALPSPH